MIKQKIISFINSNLNKNYKEIVGLELNKRIDLLDHEFNSYYNPVNRQYSFFLYDRENLKLIEYHTRDSNNNKKEVIDIINHYKTIIEETSNKRIRDNKSYYDKLNSVGSHPYIKKIPKDFRKDNEMLIIPVYRGTDKAGFYEFTDYLKVSHGSLNTKPIRLGSWYLFGSLDIYNFDQYAYIVKDFKLAYEIYHKTKVATFCFFDEINEADVSVDISHTFGFIKFIIIGRENTILKKTLMNCIIREKDELDFTREDFTEITPLGSEANEFYYYSSYGNQIHSTSHKHSHDFMLSLAPYSFYVEKFPKKNTSKGEANMADACTYFKDLCLKSGKYREDKIRELGFFKNHKDEIYCWNGKMSFGLKHKDYIHTKANDSFDIRIRRSNMEFISSKYKELIDIVAQFSWKNRLTSAESLVAWMSLAPFCGALPWKAHIYLSGDSSSGKSWTQGNLISRFLRDKHLHVTGSSSEAGVRGLLASNHVPLIFDEFERSDDRLQNLEYQKILNYLKTSSDENLVRTIKSSSSHKLHSFSGKTMASLSSIFIFLKKPEDFNRFLIFAFSKENSMSLHNFRPISKALSDFPVEDLSEHIISYLFKHFKKYENLFLKESDEFSSVLEKKMGRNNNHFSRSLGSLSAVSKLLGYNIDESLRNRWVEDHLSLRNHNNTEKDCLNFMMSSTIEIDRKRQTFKSHINDLYFASTYLQDERRRIKRIYRDDLGVFFKGDDLYICKNHRAIQDIFKTKIMWTDFYWYETLSKYLSRDGFDDFKIEKSNKNVRFGANVSFALIFKGYGKALKEEES